MLIHLGFSVVAVQHRLGHNSANATLATYVHEWNYRGAQESSIGSKLAALLESSNEPAAVSDETAVVRRLAH